GTTAADFAGSHPMTLSGGATWGLGYKGGYALALNGTSAYADAGAPVIDTSHSYTVSARVKLDSVTGWRTFVSVDGPSIGGFFRQLRADSPRFTLSAHSADDVAAPSTSADGAGTAAAGRWYMVTGIYDQTAETVSLYVDGALQGVAPALPVWRAGGH